MAQRSSSPGKSTGAKRTANAIDGGRDGSASAKRTRNAGPANPLLEPEHIRALLTRHSDQPRALLLALEALLKQTAKDEQPDLYRVLLDQASVQTLGTGELVYTLLLDHHQHTGGGALNDERLNHFGVFLALRDMRERAATAPGRALAKAAPGLLHLPDEVLQLIGWQLGHLGLVDERAAHAQEFHAVLLSFVLSNRRLAQAAAPLMRVLRWCLQGHALWQTSSWPAVCEHLMSNPLGATAPGSSEALCIASTEFKRVKVEWLDAVVLAIVYLADQGAEPLQRLFAAARAPRSPQGRSLLHLGLDQLELRLLQAEPSMNTYLMELGDVEMEPIPPDQPSLALLLEHLTSAAPEVQLFVLGSLVIAFEDFDQALQERLAEFMNQHAKQLRAINNTLHRWRNEFLDVAPDQADPVLVGDIVRALQTLPVLGGELSVRLLVKLCNHAGLRAMAGDAVLVRLLARLLHNFCCLSDELHELRIDYLFGNLPPELGVAAFQQLPVTQRASLLSAGYGHVYMPYAQAFAADTSVDRGIRIGVLHHMIRRIERDGADSAQGDLLRQLMDAV